VKTNHFKKRQLIEGILDILLCLRFEFVANALERNFPTRKHGQAFDVLVLASHVLDTDRMFADFNTVPGQNNVVEIGVKNNPTAGS
jgi:hypothetical protein